MRTVAEHLKVSAVFASLTFEDSAVGKIQAEDITFVPVWYGVELNDHRPLRDLEAISHAAERALATVQAADAKNRLTLRHSVRPMID